ncbi:isochorismatase family cysteine hydrolase [Romboutsia sedimentorum]|uniref:Isochorismatase family cysteine hydrolase n=1 Tax=Romboutsia sedimentorum TaxID=1368474 RepID=A0ABT7EAQ5_9FIRM|nr:isochorismatase family cysteine hydrolase [Romboutsia sedimentorum]MDK2564009.1 isochorismatase family cysteine hydrolase [Romboutsia sedimentorum]
MPRHGIVVIDMLNDFVGENASLRCPGGEQIVPNLQKLFTWVRERNARGLDDIQLIHVQEAHRKNDADFRVRPRHAVKGTWGSDFIKELYPQGEEYTIPKRRHSAFAHTDLDLYLREENLDTVVVTGVWTNVCVRSTASDALYNAYKVITLSDGVHSKNDEMHEAGLRDLSIFTKVMPIDEYIQAWESGLDPWVGGGDQENKVK